MIQVRVKVITDGRSMPGAPQKNDVVVRRYSQERAAKANTKEVAE